MKHPQRKRNLKKNIINEKVIAMYPVILMLIQFLKDFYYVIDSGDTSGLDTFISTYKNNNIEPMSHFAKGLLNDYEAVKNSLIYKDISNGPIEGINSRIKMKHRRSAGRAGIELLTAYMVLSPDDLAI